MNDIITMNNLEELNDYVDDVKTHIEAIIKQVRGIDIDCKKTYNYDNIPYLEFQAFMSISEELEIVKILEKSKFSNWELIGKSINRELCYYSLFNKDFYQDKIKYNRGKYLKELING